MPFYPSLPAAGQSAALVGTNGSPGAANPFVTDSDPRNTDARTPDAHAASHSTGQSDAMVATNIGGVATDDSRLSDARTPTNHGNDKHTSTFVATDDARLTDARTPTNHGSDKHTVAYLPATPETIQLDTTPTVGDYSTGKLFYDTPNKTLSMHMGGDVTMQIGQEEYVYVYNPGAEITNGQVVRFLGNQGDYPTVALAKADAESTSYALGVATQTITSTGYGFVNVRGMVRDINTMGAVSGSIDSYTDYGSGLVRAHCTAAHNLTTGNSVVITDVVYGGTYTVTVDSTTTFTFTATWSVTSSGTFTCAQTWTSGDLLWLSPTTAGSLTNVEPGAPDYRARIARVVTTSATTGIIYVRVFAFTKLSYLGDVAIDTPAVDQLLRYNGAQWINGSPAPVSAGAGVDFFPDDTAIYAVSANNTWPVKTLSKTPVTTTEDVDSINVTSATSPVPYGMYLYNAALGATAIDAGTWAFDIYTAVSSSTNATSLTQGVYRVRPEAGTVTIDNVSGTTARCTASTGTPFDTAKITASTDKSLCSYVMITNNTTGLYPIIARTGNTVVTIQVPAGYTPGAASTYQVCKSLFTVNTGELNNAATAPLYAGLALYPLNSVQSAFVIEATDKFATMFFGVSDGTRTVYFSHNGTTRYTHFRTPLVTRHNDLAGLQGGASNDYVHLTTAKATEVNAGTIVTTAVSNTSLGLMPQITTANYYPKVNAAGTGIEYVSDRLFANTTVNIANNLTSAQIQALIDAQPKNLNGYTLTFQFADSSTSQVLTAALNFNWFNNGTIFIQGNAGESGLHSNQAVFLDFSGSSTNGIVADSCSVSIIIINLKIKIKVDSYQCIILNNNGLSDQVVYCYLLCAGSPGETQYPTGVSVQNGCRAHISDNYFDGLSGGVQCTNSSTITSKNNVKTGNTIRNGLVCYYGATIGKSGTQPAATTAELVFDGGSIRS